MGREDGRGKVGAGRGVGRGEAVGISWGWMAGSPQASAAKGEASPRGEGVSYIFQRRCTAQALTRTKKRIVTGFLRKLRSCEVTTVEDTSPPV